MAQSPAAGSGEHPSTRPWEPRASPSAPCSVPSDEAPPGWRPPVEEDAADIVVRDGGLLGAGCHPQGPQEVVDQDVQLLHVLGLGLQHAEHHLVPLAHAVGVGGPDVVLDDGLPLPAAQPAPQEALHLPSKRGLRQGTG